MIEHSLIPVGEIHGIINWEVASTGARDALSVNTSDQGKVCHVVGDQCYILVDAAGPTWETLSNFATSLQEAKDYADSLVVGLWDDRGNYDASGGAYPTTGGSGTAGAILKGDLWTISVAGTLPTGQVVEVGDTVRAKVDTPGNTQANWAILQNNIGYTPESSANKSTDVALGSSNTLYPSQNAVKTYVDTLIAAASPEVLTRITKETWLIEDFIGYYGTAAWLQSFTNTTRQAVNGSAQGLTDAMGCMRAVANANTAGGYYTCGWATSSGTQEFKLSANPIVLFATISIETFGVAGSAPVYYLALSSGTLIPATSSGANPGAVLAQNKQIVLMIYKDGSGNIIARAYTNNGITVPTTEDDYSVTTAFTVDTKINLAIVATSTSVKYYIDGSLFREVTDVAKIPTGDDLAAQLGYQTGLGVSAGGFTADIVGIGRKFSTNRVLQLPSVS